LADKFTREQRSKIMAKISGRGTKPEVLVRKFLSANGFRYRLNVSGLPGKPDIVLRKFKTVIFVNGCFWHGHTGCRRAGLPKTNTAFWRKKITKNRQRDLEVTETLQAEGWKVITVWQCDIANLDAVDRTMMSILRLLNS
jgi:DNA mismatch endonuclease (patch repair protein)